MQCILFFDLAQAQGWAWKPQAQGIPWAQPPWLGPRFKPWAWDSRPKVFAKIYLQEIFQKTLLLKVFKLFSEHAFFPHSTQIS